MNLNTDYLDPQNMPEMAAMADPSIALEFLLTVKSGIRNYAFAVAEAATPQVRMTLRNQLEEAIEMHDKLSSLMISKGWLHPDDLHEQFQLDMKSAGMALALAGMQLFPETSTRRRQEV